MPTVPRGASASSSTGRLNSSSFFLAKRFGASVLAFLWPAPFSQAVAGDEATAAAEVVDGEQTVIGAAATAGMLLGHGQARDFVGRKDGRGARLARTVARKQRGAVGAHAAGDIGTDGVDARELLEGAQGGVGHERAALNDDLRADLFGIAQP